MLPGLVTGAGFLLRGFGFWRRRPGAMLLGLVPAALVFLVMLAALIALGFNLGWLAEAVTPFADDWTSEWALAARLFVGALLFAGALVLVSVTFTALTLMVGDPFYERIWRAVELELGGEVPETGTGFWRSARASAALIALGAVTALGVGLVGFVPVVGAVAAPVLGVALSGRLLARELTSRAFDARGLTAEERRSLMRGRRWQLLGFGAATQLLFLIPLGAVITMPAAVAGSTMLARAAIDLSASPEPSAPDRSVRRGEPAPGASRASSPRS